ncbi:hypothetical protein INH39_11220 [Massilia violaceinigra]|uniref:Uncharacterized protein n=1 Tax=Massilia violaceinigra TaxID=2045208 RepID=A0ABY4ABL2_9BURK|nr:hypothetical protein [Massilia violaceinigra]UOD32181.1 hypothetical protein INH39_11220 [Massilia violaceinigra]
MSTLLQTAGDTALSLLPLVQGAAWVLGIAAVALFFKPLLVGIFRALVLVVKPRMSKDQMAAQRNMRNARLLQRMTNSSSGNASLTAELRAMAARS